MLLPRLELGLLSLLLVKSVGASLLHVGASNHASLLQQHAELRSRSRPSLDPVIPSIALGFAASGNKKKVCGLDHSGFDSILRKFVTKSQKKNGIQSTLFDYKALLGNDDSLSKFRDYIDSLSTAEASCSSSLAFWANTYNALIINVVLSAAEGSGGKLPKSIKDLKGNEDSVWSRRAGKVAGKVMTLEDVLTEARKLGDPRIHAAVNCGSLSCPDLRARAYSDDDIDAQLDKQVQKWLKNPTKGSKEVKGGVMVSPIFEWHAEDFTSVSSFVCKSLALSSCPAVSGYLTYHWELNAGTKSTASEA